MSEAPLFVQRKTPGVYITETAALPSSIVGVATAVPIFIGYTQTAVEPNTGKAHYLQAVPISSLADYCSVFGGGLNAQGIVELVDGSTIKGDFEAASADGGKTTPLSYVVGTGTTMTGAVSSTPWFNLFAAVQLFYTNGGGNCFVISVNNYWGEKNIEADAGRSIASPNVEDLLAGLTVASQTVGGTMLVVPDACLLATSTTANGATTYTYPGYQRVAVEMLRQAGTLQDRMAILDMPGALFPENWSISAMAHEAQDFYTALVPAAPYFSYGAAYGPALQSSLLSGADLRFSNLCGTSTSVAHMNNVLTTQALSLYPPDSNGRPTPAFIRIAAHIAAAFPVVDAIRSGASLEGTGIARVGIGNAQRHLQVSLSNSAVCAPPTDASGIAALDRFLIGATPLLQDVKNILASKLSVVPPSGVLAGVWAQNDINNGVWNAPANIALNGVVAPKVVMNDEEQGPYNVPVNGNAINVLRAMHNRGTVVWGARTLDGNSNDYRYIHVRRTLIYIEQSIKSALQSYTFAPNDGPTWAAVTSTISAFLTQLWQAGGLLGNQPSEAFRVACGVPETMTGQQVLDGYLIVSVTLQMVHPAEFIQITFAQQVQAFS